VSDIKLSIIIVNYNVKHFLEQCLYSVFSATKNVKSEVFVVDNNSVDGSCAMVKEKFTNVILIENKQNTGFSKANNQAIKIAKGEYILLLNPDTLVEEDTFKKVVAFMDKTTDAGGLGVKMIDGSGNFLPESKRGLPTPDVAFYKIFGLSKLFPNSKKFGKYHLTYLDKNKIHKIDVLSGAFMLMRKSVIDKVGMLDESYFMYGEDIDLSYRITLSGYNNYYFPDTTIIHYKGESTKKGSINYVRIFYKAMIIFSKNHFSGSNAKLLIFLINFAIYLRAAIALFSRFIKSSILPLIDASIISGSFIGIKKFWEIYKYKEGYFPNDVLEFTIIGCIIIWLLNIYIIGGYDKPVKIKQLIKGILSGALFVLVFYALLPENLRFSRAVTLLVSATILISIPVIRYILYFSKISLFKLDFNKKLRFVIVASINEATIISNVLSQNINKPEIIGFVSINDGRKGFIGNISQISEINKIHKPDEIIFSAKDLSSQDIIKNILALSDTNTTFRIASPDSLTVVGSNNLDSQGDLYSFDFNTITKPINKRLKRIFDVILSVILIVTLPISILFVDNKTNLIGNILKVITGIKSWVGYKNKSNLKLPKIKDGIISLSDIYTTNDKNKIDKNNINYARNYKVYNDLLIIVKAFKYLGNK